MDCCTARVARYGQGGEFKVSHFIEYLHSVENKIFLPLHDVICEDMTLPLTHYFIDSSHNTYLEGDQLKSKSSTEVSTLRERLDEAQTKLDAQRSRFEAETAECVFFRIALLTPTPLPRNASRHHGISTRLPVCTHQKKNEKY